MCTYPWPENFRRWLFHQKHTNETHIFFGDALEHRAEANKVINVALESFRNCNENEPIELLRCMHHEYPQNTRPCGHPSCTEHKTRQWKICSIGNIIKIILLRYFLNSFYQPYD